MEEVLFFLAALGALGGAVGVIASRNPFYGVLALVIHLFSLAVLFLLLTAAFLAAAQVVVYAGAVMVLYVFVVAYVGGGEESAWEPIPGQRLLAPLVGIALFVELAVAVLASSLLALGTDGPDVNPGFGDPAAIGTLLLEKFLIPFEAASILLLLAAVGAVVLAGKRRGASTTGGDDGSSSLATRRLDGGKLPPDSSSSSRAKRSEDPLSPPARSTTPSPPTSAGQTSPGATGLGVADDKGSSLSAISESGAAAAPFTQAPTPSPSAASDAPHPPERPSPAVDGGGVSPERFAREELRPSGDSPIPNQRRVASEGDTPPPSPAGGVA